MKRMNQLSQRWNAGLRAVKWQGFIRTEQLPREI